MLRAGENERMKVLLTGGSGQVGRRLRPLLLAAGHDVTAPSRAELDLTDARALRDAVRSASPRLVINAAAWTDVEAAEDDPRAMEVNALAPGILAGEAARAGAALIHFSTDYVHDGTSLRAYTEHDPASPLNAYGRGKLAGDHAVLASGAPALILRLSWVYDSTGSNFLLKVLSLLRERETLQVVNDQRGAPTPAPVIADAVMKILASADDPAALFRRAGGVVNLACRGWTTWHGFAEEIRTMAGTWGAAIKTARIEPITAAQYRGKARRPLNSRMRLIELRRRFAVVPPHWRTALRQLFASDGASMLGGAPTDGRQTKVSPRTTGSRPGEVRPVVTS
jgi:dTDP-4-dehydrorhamnose reductase